MTARAGRLGKSIRSTARPTARAVIGVCRRGLCRHRLRTFGLVRSGVAGALLSVLLGVALAVAGCAPDATSGAGQGAGAGLPGSVPTSTFDGDAQESYVTGATIAPDAPSSGETHKILFAVQGAVPADGAADADARAATDSAASAVIEEARARGDTVERVELDASQSVDSQLQALADEHADIIVFVGAELNAAIDRVSASNLDQRFLLLGAQLPEPTDNVTAVIWDGADARDLALYGTTGQDDASDDTAAEPDALQARLGTAYAAGVQAIDAGRTGIVVDLDHE